MIEDREQLQDPDADNDGDDLPVSDPRPEAPVDPELEALIAAGEDLPTDEEEDASPPPDDPECRVTPDEPS
jgi:hypothetical protein